jgi:hypothetical protein
LMCLFFNTVAFWIITAKKIHKAMFCCLMFCEDKWKHQAQTISAKDQNHFFSQMSKLNSQESLGWQANLGIDTQGKSKWGWMHGLILILILILLLLHGGWKLFELLTKKREICCTAWWGFFARTGWWLLISTLHLATSMTCETLSRNPHLSIRT